MKKRRSRRKVIAADRDSLKEEDSSPTSTSQIVNTATTSPFVHTADDDLISSSTLSCDDRPTSSPSSLERVLQKQTVNSPPDDVRAFFGHPLTRATNALNGDDLDTNANADALLHEYINLPTIDRDELKSNEKLPGFHEIISQRSDPQFSRAGSETARSTAAADSHSSGTGHSNHDTVHPYGKVLVEETSPQGESMNITEYVEIFLNDEFSLDLIDEQAEGQHDSRKSIVTSERTSDQCARRSKPTKASQGSVLQKREKLGNPKRTPRKSQTKPDVISSTTNSLPAKLKDGQTVTNDVSVTKRYQAGEIGVISRDVHGFEGQGVVIKPQSFANRLPDIVAPSAGVCCNVIPSKEEFVIPASSRLDTTQSGGNRCSILEQKPANQQLKTPATEILNLKHPAEVFTVVAATFNNCNNNTIPSPHSNHHITTTCLSSTSTSVSPIATMSTASNLSASSPAAMITDSLQNVSHSKENNLKKVLSEKIRSRQMTDDALGHMPVQFLTQDISAMELDTKLSSIATIKEEDHYVETYDQQYAYGSDISALANYSALAMTSFGSEPQDVVSVNMETCEDSLTLNDANNNGMNGMRHNSLLHIQSESGNNSHHHQHHLHSADKQQQNNHLNISSSHQNMEESMIVQSSQGQYFQVLQPLQPFESACQVTSTIPTNSNIITTAGNYYNNIYQREQHPHLLEADRNLVVEQYLHQQHQYAYSGGYSHFLNPDNNYNMKSPDSGYQEPCLSPTSSAVTQKDAATNGSIEAKKDKPKKKITLLELEGQAGEVGEVAIVKQPTSSGSDKKVSRSATIRKLGVNPTGYSYFMETPISTTQRRDEDRVTYVNKSQYYGLSLEFNSQDRHIKAAGVKSVIILTFREEKMMEEEKKAWEFWHGRQHSYKQRILDIDTKNCHGVTPQNIEEVAFNAVAVKWNPMDGPVRVNIAVHCLSTDFSNQKGVKGIPLHIQIDTYEQSPKDSFLVHRGYCQIKAFCDKGAERKTRDEERRKTSKNKTDDFGDAPVGAKSKGRRKTEEAFHNPCDRSEFYSMVDITTPPVFFNPSHENSEFIHKSLTLGVVPSQDEEITSLPSGLELPDSCDDYDTTSPAKRSRLDSCSNSCSNFKDQPKVLLYVRERHETVYTALMLEVPTLHGLLKSIEQKYSIAPFNVRNLYKKSRKGILVKLDDNIVRHYSHEATFIIETNLLSESGEYEITLTEIDATSS